LKLKIKINDEVRVVDVTEEAPSQLLVNIRGRSYKCQVDEFDEGETNSSEKMRTTLHYGEVRSALADSTVETENTVAPACSIDVKSPLPGTISSIECKVGSLVKKGDVVLYLEAMKMLNDIVAPHDGIIERFDKSQGQTVNVGDVLFRLRVTGE